MIYINYYFDISVHSKNVISGQILVVGDFNLQNISSCNDICIINNDLSVEIVKNNLNLFNSSSFNNKHNLNKIITDSKMFWNFINENNQSELNTCYKTNDTIIDDSLKISNEFANYFALVFATDSKFDDNMDLNVSKFINNAECISVKDIPLDEVFWSIKKILPKKSCRPDGIPPYILKG